MIRKIYFQVNRKYFDIGPDDIQERFKRKQDEFGYEKMDPIRLIELISELIDIFCDYKVETENTVK